MNGYGCMALVPHQGLIPQNMCSLHSSLLLISPCGQDCCGNVFLRREDTFVSWVIRYSLALLWQGDLEKQSNQICEVADVFQKNMRWDGAQDKEIQNNKVTPSLMSCTFSVKSCSKAKKKRQIEAPLSNVSPVISTKPHLSIYLANTHQFSLKFKISYKALDDFVERCM